MIVVRSTTKKKHPLHGLIGVWKISGVTEMTETWVTQEIPREIWPGLNLMRLKMRHETVFTRFVGANKRNAKPRGVCAGFRPRHLHAFIVIKKCVDGRFVGTPLLLNLVELLKLHETDGALKIEWLKIPTGMLENIFVIDD